MAKHNMWLVPRFLILVCLSLLKICQASSSQAIESGNSDSLEAYQFSEEEAQAYWKKRGHLTSKTEKSIEKRGYYSASACARMDRDHHDSHGQLLGRHMFKWMTAECVDPFGGGGLFDVHCEHTFHEELPSRVTFLDAGKHRKECPPLMVCVPSREARYNGVGQVGPHLDIQCVPQDSIPKPMAFKSSFWDDVVQCTGDVRLPEETTHQRYIPRQGLTYLLTEQIEYADGKKYNASKLYIEDRTSRIFKPWHRTDVTKASIAAADVTIFAHTQKAVIRFCAELAKGSARWFVLHYGAFRTTGKRSRITNSNTADLNVEDQI